MSIPCKKHSVSYSIVFVLFLSGELETFASPRAGRFFATGTDVRFFTELCIALSQTFSCWHVYCVADA